MKLCCCFFFFTVAVDLYFHIFCSGWWIKSSYHSTCFPISSSRLVLVLKSDIYYKDICQSCVYSWFLPPSGRQKICYCRFKYLRGLFIGAQWACGQDREGRQFVEKDNVLLFLFFLWDLISLYRNSRFIPQTELSWSVGVSPNTPRSLLVSLCATLISQICFFSI